MHKLVKKNNNKLKTFEWKLKQGNGVAETYDFHVFLFFFPALRWCFGLHGYTLAVEETQRHQSCFLTDQTLWERNANLCCDNADLLFRSRGIGPAGGEKRREGELRMMGKGKKIALVERRGEERSWISVTGQGGKGVSVWNMKSWEAGDGESGGGGVN